MYFNKPFDNSPISFMFIQIQISQRPNSTLQGCEVICRYKEHMRFIEGNGLDLLFYNMVTLTVLLTFLCVSFKLKRTERRTRRRRRRRRGEREWEREREKKKKIMYEKLVRDSGTGSNNTSEEDETVEANIKEKSVMNREGRRKNYKNYWSKEQRTEWQKWKRGDEDGKKDKKTVTSKNIRCIRDCLRLNRFVCDRIRTERNVLILLASCQKTCTTYIIAVCTVKISWWWTEELSEICRVLFQK